MISSRESAADRREREGTATTLRRVVEPRKCAGCPAIIPACDVAKSPKTRFCAICGFRRAMARGRE
jgi:hypothetical protein